MPRTIFDCKGISAARRKRTGAAVEAAGRRFAQPYEGWIAADPFRVGVHVLSTGPQGFERTVTFPLDEAPGDDHGAGARDHGRLTASIPGTA